MALHIYFGLLLMWCFTIKDVFVPNTLYGYHYKDSLLLTVPVYSQYLGLLSYINQWRIA